MATALPSRREQRVRRREPRLWHKGAYALVVLFLLATFGLLAVALPSVVDNFRAATRLYNLTRSGGPLNPTLARLHLDLIALDEWQGTMTIRVSESRVCRPACTASGRIVLVAAQQSVLGVEGLPASAAVTLPASADEVTQIVTLPIHGAPLRYPFDPYHLRLGIIPERVTADGTVHVLTPAEEQGSLAVSLHDHLPGTVMDPPTLLDPSRVPIPDNTDHYAVVADLRFARPLYTRVLCVLLVLLVAATAAYAVVLRPMSDLVANAGALMLGVWGMRAILAGTERPGGTALDLALAVVILFLLGGVTARVLLDLDQRSGFSLVHRAARRLAPPPDAESDHRAALPGEPTTARPRSRAGASDGKRSARCAHRLPSQREQREN